jgi:hypothetical protein
LVFSRLELSENETQYLIWQMGFFNCSTYLVSSLRVMAQVDEALTAVVGDCQYVLFKVTVPPQVEIVSEISYP